MEDVTQLAQRLLTATTREEISLLIAKLIPYGEEAVPSLLSFAASAYQAKNANTVVKALREIGYPANRSALDYLVSVTSNSNSPAFAMAREMLVEIGEPAVDHIGEALDFYAVDLGFYNDCIQELRSVLSEIRSPT